MEILFYLAMLGCTGFLLFSMMRAGTAAAHHERGQGPREG